MQLAPNSTKITATITKVFEGNVLEIVILKIPTGKLLSAFLWVGKQLTVINQFTSNLSFVLKEGEIISAEIEIIGDPFKQTYFINNISKTGKNI
jgi:formylmethanofuran dehydrogenase subunit A